MQRSNARSASPWDLATVGTAPIGLATWLLLVGGLVVLAASAAPSLLRNMGLTEATVLVSPLAAGVETPKGIEEDVHRSVRNLERQIPPADDEIVHAPRGFDLRADPSDTSPEVGKVKKGTLVLVMRDEGDWVLVMVPGARKSDEPSLGWVREESLR